MALCQGGYESFGLSQEDLESVDKENQRGNQLTNVYLEVAINRICVCLCQSVCMHDQKT